MSWHQAIATTLTWASRWAAGNSSTGWTGLNSAYCDAALALGPLQSWLADAFRAADLPDLGHIHLPGVVVDALAARRNGPTAHDGRYQRCARWLWHHVERQLILGSWRERLAITKRQTSFERLMHAINSPPEAGVAALMDPEYDGLRAHRRADHRLL